MRKKLLFTLLLIFPVFILTAQDPPLISGPMLGYVEHRSVLIWAEVSQDVKSAKIRYWEVNNADFYYEMDYTGLLGNPYNTIRFELVKLKMNVVYEYEIVLNGKAMPAKVPQTFRTKKLWEHREDPPDFSFTAGSCAYINDEPYDRPGKPYGKSPKIFKTIDSLGGDFMVWLGDNVYFREADYSSKAGMQYRYSNDRRTPEMAGLLAGRANYAIWDDHDYSPNNSGRNWELKTEALDLFKNYWGNKSYGEPGNPGTYSRFTWSDCEFFMMDDRTYRASNNWRDSVDGKPDCSKTYYGDTQLTWLFNALLESRATFKFIVTGNQVLNPENRYESFRRYSCEYNKLMNFIQQNRINGVVFLSGDRHFSEVIAIKPESGYTLYDITSSPLTSSAFDLAKKPEPEFENPSRVPGTLVTVNNYCMIFINGKGAQRSLNASFIDADGKILSGFSIEASSLKF